MSDTTGRTGFRVTHTKAVGERHARRADKKVVTRALLRASLRARPRPDA